MKVGPTMNGKRRMNERTCREMSLFLFIYPSIYMRAHFESIQSYYYITQPYCVDYSYILFCLFLSFAFIKFKKIVWHQHLCVFLVSVENQSTYVLFCFVLYCCSYLRANVLHTPSFLSSIISL